MLSFGGRGLVARAAAILLVAGPLVVVGVGTQAPASAAIVCRETFAGTPSDIAVRPADNPWAGASDITVPTDRTVATVRATLDITHPQSSTLQLFLMPPGAKDFQPNAQLFYSTADGTTSTSGPMNGFYTFDDAAATSIGGANKPPGLYKPVTPLGKLAGRSTGGTWVLWINNYGGPAGRLRSISLTLTYADCPDANGDGLHDDADGDGVLMPPDNCPDLANPDQLDSDVDGIGDACDPTPYLPPPPPVGQAGQRDVTVKYAKKIHRLKGAVTSEVASCANGVEVEVWKRRTGEDRRLASVKTSASGKFRTPRVKRPGRYYVSVASAFVDLGAVECVARTSRAVKVR